MIYFFDNELNMVKVATSKNVISAVHEHELNGLILGTVETDLSYTEAFINDVDYFGYYYKDNYYLHKIKRVEHEHENELVRITGRHIFFEDMLYGDYIRDVRPVNRDALYILNQTISANTRWQTVMTDTSKLHSETYYWVPPMEVLNDLTENVGIEYEPKILFDGQKINGFQLHVANRIGEDTPIRVPFGSRVINLKYEVDYSEIVTALYGHGKGEEVGDGYGRRINFSSVNFSRNGVVSPAGQLYMENPNVTAQYGKDDGSPKFGRVVFEDIEIASELANATYEAYLEQSRPKMLFEASVVDLGDVGMGDGVLIIRREYDVYFNARIHKLMVDLLDAENADVELGDYAHFKESKVQRKTRENNNQYKRETSSRIQQLKEQFNDRFDGEVNQMREDFEQALIDAHAEIQAAEERMEALITTTRNDWTDTFDAEVAEIYRKADEDYNRIETEITGVIDSTREEMEMDFNADVQNTREYAEQQAAEKADAVQSNLESATSSHQGMIDDLQSSVLDIDDFLGSDRNIGLNEMLYNERMLFEERINSINTWHYNLLRETQSLDSDFWEAINGTLEADENGDRFYKASSSIESAQRVIRSKQPFYFEVGETYTLTFEAQTYRHKSMDYIWIINRDPEDSKGNFWLSPNADKTNADVIHFSSSYRRYYITFTMPRSIHGDIQIGGDYRSNELGLSEYRIKKPYLTQSDNKQWLHNPEDKIQNLEEVTRRVTLLEDGREEFITKTQFDFETGEIEGTMRNILETVDGRESIIQNHEDWINTNGASVIESAEGFQSRAWLADIHNPNMIAHSDITTSENRQYWSGYRTNIVGISYQNWVRVRNTDSSTVLGYQTPEMAVVQGEEYTVSWLAWTDDDGFDMRFDYCYVMYPSASNQGLPIPERRNTGETIAGNIIYEYELTFVSNRSDENARLLFGGRTSAEGIDTSFRMRHPKLELGDRATPYHNAYSMFNQRADSIALQVDDQESMIANFTVDLDGIIGRVSDIEGDYITQSYIKTFNDSINAVSSRVSDVEDNYIEQSSIEITPDYAQIGSMRIDGDTVGSMLRVSPDGIDAVAEAMRLSGDLYVDGDITALAVDAIEGNFARLWADEFEAITITGEHIEANTITVQHLTGADAILNYLMARQVFSEEVTSLVGNFVDVNAGNIVTSGLSANVIESEHIAVGTALIDKMFATSARIDQLITKTHFVNEIKATSIDAVHADFSSATANWFSANMIESEWLDVDTALFNRFTANNAFIDSLTSKSAFIRDVQAIDISAERVTGGVLRSQNNNTYFSLNTGRLKMENTNFILGGGADIRFEDVGNRLYYNLTDTETGTPRTAGVGIGRSINDRFPYVFMGTTGTARNRFNPIDENWFTGFISNTNGRMLEDNIGNSVVGDIFHVRDEAVGFRRGFTFDLKGSRKYFAPMRSGVYTYDLGKYDNSFSDAYIQRARPINDFEVVNNFSLRQRFVLDVSYNDESTMAFYGAYTSENYYDLGRSYNRFSTIYLKYNPDISSDIRTKTDIKSVDFASEILEQIDPIQYRKKLTDADLKARNEGRFKRGRNNIEFGFSAQQVKTVIEDFGITDQSIVNTGKDNYLGLQINQFIPLLVADNNVARRDIKTLFDLDDEKDKRIKALEKEIELLKGV